ncbi:HU family DNA-binding protein [Wolbachia endosymbiont of Pentalonia nigronervosa]|uniref:HU family DNA-binding protein n=1 Tax=Wolbachia endosymbiont of Pentalonia nigronervosa TaxID=1301914 RepID=UPI00165F222B|nr:HU family DNA-binding protein [Wolbachia endosymbiont of Pentalonia nigronervosa]MBD0392085.1 HU family DNA-binding protein [Wolbachia endosymbiont of Pentalonia nigronervosa]
MSKKQIIDELIKNKDILGIKNSAQASLIFDFIINTLKNKLYHLGEGEYFRLHNIGRFYPVNLKSRIARNPLTGQTFTIPSNKKIRFKSYLSSNST